MMQPQEILDRAPCFTTHIVTYDWIPAPPEYWQMRRNPDGVFEPLVWSPGRGGWVPAYPLKGDLHNLDDIRKLGYYKGELQYVRQNLAKTRRMLSVVSALLATVIIADILILIGRL